MPKVRTTRRSTRRSTATIAADPGRVISAPAAAREHESNTQELIHEFRQMCTSIAVPEGDVQGMEAYMRSQFKFFGLRSPIRKKLQLSFIRTHADALRNRPFLLALCSALWDESEREFQYFAVDLLRHFKQELVGGGTPVEFYEVMNCVQNLITTKSWWDTVDGLAYPGKC